MDDKPQQLKVTLTFDIASEDYTEDFAQQLAVNVSNCIRNGFSSDELIPEDTQTEMGYNTSEKEVGIETNFSVWFDFVL